MRVRRPGAGGVLVMWLLTWGALSGLLIGGLVLINGASELRRLRASRIPRPGLLLWRRMLGRLPGVSRSTAGPPLTGRLAWLAWDLRWTAAGETLARVVRADAASGELDLELAEPTAVAPTAEAASARLSAVRFVPQGAGHATCDRAAVRGVLRPALPGGLTATAEVVVYPAAHGA